MTTLLMVIGVFAVIIGICFVCSDDLDQFNITKKSGVITGIVMSMVGSIFCFSQHVL